MINILNDYRLKPSLITELNALERFQGAWEHTVHQQSPHFIKELKQATIITSSGASTRIEGALLSDEEVKVLVQQGCHINTMSSRSEREVTGYVKTLKYIYENYQSLPISEFRIRELHKLLTSELLEEHLASHQRGSYKTVSNDVVEKNHETGEEKVWFQTTPPGPQTEVAMRELVTDLSQLFDRGELSRPLTIAAFVVTFLAIHPFRDGNGRLSRLLTIWLLLRAGYDWVQYSSHEKVIEDNKNHYYVQLRNAQLTLTSESPTFDDWFRFFLMILNSQCSLLKEKLRKESPKSELIANEAKIYDVIKEHGKVSPSFLLQHVDMTSNGLKSLLQRLVERGLIEAEGEKRGRKYKVKFDS
jgi:Fic family protein